MITYRLIRRWFVGACATASAACGPSARLPVTAGIGPSPTLPQPETSLIPTVKVATAKGWAVVIPVEAWTGGIASAVLIGASAGLLPAVRASRMPPTVALRTV